MVTSIGDDIKQLFNTFASHRGYDPELGQMSADGVAYRGLLADKEMARAMQHQAALLLGRLGLDQPHVGPGDRFADGLGVSGIILLSLDVWLHIGRRHQAHGMPERLEFTRPMMRRGAGFDANQARRQLLEECQDVTTLQLTADAHVAFNVNAVDLKYRLCDIETDSRNGLHDWLLRIVGALTAPTSMALMCR